MSDRGRVVYSSGDGRVCPGCGHPVRSCACSRGKPDGPVGDGRVRVRREVSGRRGKAVTAVRGVALAGDDLRALAKELKKRCGAGGTVKDGVIEIQGDHVDAVVEALRALGHDARRAGG